MISKLKLPFEITIIISVFFAVVSVYSEAQLSSSKLDGIVPGTLDGAKAGLKSIKPGLKAVLPEGGNSTVGANTTDPKEWEAEKEKNATDSFLQSVFSPDELTSIKKTFDMQDQIESIIEMMKNLTTSLNNNGTKNGTSSKDSGKGIVGTGLGTGLAGTGLGANKDTGMSSTDTANYQKILSELKTLAAKVSPTSREFITTIYQNISKIPAILKAENTPKSTEIKSNTAKANSNSTESNKNATKINTNVTEILTDSENILTLIEDGSIDVKNKSESNAAGVAMADRGPEIAIQNLTTLLEQMKLEVVTNQRSSIISGIETALPAFLGLSEQLPTKDRHILISMVENITDIPKELTNGNKIEAIHILTNISSKLFEIGGEVKVANLEKKAHKSIDDIKSANEAIKQLGTTMNGNNTESSNSTSSGNSNTTYGNITQAINEIENVLPVLNGILPYLSTANQTKYNTVITKLKQMEPLLKKGNKVDANYLYRQIYSLLFPGEKVPEIPKPIVLPSTPQALFSLLEKEVFAKNATLIPAIVDKLVPALQNLSENLPAAVCANVTSIIDKINTIPDLMKDGKQQEVEKTIEEIKDAFKKVGTPITTPAKGNGTKPTPGDNGKGNSTTPKPIVLPNTATALFSLLQKNVFVKNSTLIPVIVDKLVPALQNSSAKLPAAARANVTSIIDKINTIPDLMKDGKQQEAEKTINEIIAAFKQLGAPAKGNGTKPTTPPADGKNTTTPKPKPKPIVLPSTPQELFSLLQRNVLANNATLVPTIVDKLMPILQNSSAKLPAAARANVTSIITELQKIPDLMKDGKQPEAEKTINDIIAAVNLLRTPKQYKNLNSTDISQIQSILNKAVGTNYSRLLTELLVALDSGLKGKDSLYDILLTVTNLFVNLIEANGTNKKLQNLSEDDQNKLIDIMSRSLGANNSKSIVKLLTMLIDGLSGKDSLGNELVSTTGFVTDLLGGQKIINSLLGPIGLKGTVAQLLREDGYNPSKGLTNTTKTATTTAAASKGKIPASHSESLLDFLL